MPFVNLKNCKKKDLFEKWTCPWNLLLFWIGCVCLSALLVTVYGVLLFMDVATFGFAGVCWLLVDCPIALLPLPLLCLMLSQIGSRNFEVLGRVEEDELVC